MARQSAAKEIGIRLPALTILMASFLSGAMASISAVTIPVLLDTNIHPIQLLRQWSRLYHYGHALMPSMAIATTGLFAYLALQRRTAADSGAANTTASRRAKIKKQRPLIYVAAGAATIAIVPFTFLAMMPTNETLFRLEKLASLALEEQAEAVVDLGLVQKMVVKWTWLHVIRSMFPLAGAILGFSGLMQELIEE